MNAKQVETATTSPNEQAGQQQALPARQPNASQGAQDIRMTSRSPYFLASPFTLLQRFLKEDLSNHFEDTDTRLGRANGGTRAVTDLTPWSPKIDVMQRGDELVIQAELPGIPADDVTVEVTDNAVVIAGEKQEEQVTQDRNLYKFERTYGSFFREVPLPEGAIAEQARASFKDGVLEIVVPAQPNQITRGRRLEIERK